MKLISIALRSFRQHHNTLIEFKSGLTGIIGVNGAGKTTLVEAIAYALYGSKAARGKVDDLLSKGLRSASELKVTLIFENDGTVYRIERGIDDALLYAGGESSPIVRGNREVATKVAGLLAMNYEEFSATFLTEQKGLEFLSGKKGATERERFIVRMMGYDRLEKVQEGLRNDRRDKRNELSGGEAGLGLRSEIETRIEKEKNDLALVEEKHAEAIRVLEKAEKEEEEQKIVYKKLQSKFEEFSKLKKNLQNRNYMLEQTAKRKTQLQMRIHSVAAYQQEKESIFAELHALLPEVKWPSAHETKNLHKLISQQLELLKQMRQNIELELQQRYEGWQMQLAAASGGLNSQERLCEAMRKRQERFTTLDEQGPCPTCGQELGDSYHSVKDHFMAETAKETAALDACRASYEAVRNQPVEISGLQAKIKHCSETENLIAKISRRFTEIEGSLLESERLKVELLETENEEQLITAAINAEEKAVSELGFSEEEYTKQRIQYESVQRLLEVSRLQRVKLEGDCNTVRALLDRSRQDLKNYDAKSRLLDETRKELILFEESDRILIDFRKYLNAQLRPRLAELAGEYLSELTDGRYIAVDIASDFTPTVMEDGVAKSVISGGEEDLLNLCVRLALSNMLAERAGQSFSLLILDEVFGSLDENRRNNVLLLLDKLSSRFEQILLITHLEDIREGVQNLISINFDESSGEISISDPLSEDTHLDEPNVSNY